MPTPDRLSAALADRYRIERELGSGSMATVYLAHDLRHDRKVALKVLRDSLGVPAVTRRQALFDRSRFTPGSPSWREYDISRDGQRFLFARSLSGRAPPEPIVVLNWTAAVRRVMAAARAR
jgi:serine/threonine protein kinase